MTTYTLVGGTYGSTFQAKSGTQYAPDTAGKVTGVALIDLPDLLGDGLRLNDSTLNPSANGLYATTLPLMNSWNSDGSIVAAAAASGKFGKTVSLGTTTSLVSEAANNNTKTDTVMFDLVLPRTYVAGQDITVTAFAGYTVGGGTIGTHTLDATAYLTAAAGTQGSDLVSTAAQSLPATAADIVHTIAGATLLPGSRILLSLVLVISETASSAITANIYSVRLS